MAAGCSGGESSREVHVELRFSRFVPDTFEFAAGTTVTFVVENRDPIDHEFLIGDEEVQRAHEEGTEEHHGAKPGEISVPAGETRETTYTFEEPGTLLIGCHLPTHYDYGMRGEITVTEE
ncbi:MAG: plastocyanin/azurin family copper-binding protein [Actinomycetota bacterium]|nr:plastocyanin/azurin family copper-binding protein [Actinomycetota bacterium]